MTAARRAFTALAFGGCLLGGCTLLPGEAGGIRVTTAPEAGLAPVDAPVAFVETRLRRDNGVIYNRLGGEIPRGAPVVPVEERELGEIARDTVG